MTAGFSENIRVLSVEPSKVPDYLNAADFAISFANQTFWSFALSPIKHAEYWATGLPVICPSNVGDDAQRIPGTVLGGVADFGVEAELEKACIRIREIMLRPHYRAEIRQQWLETFDANAVYNF